MSHLSRADILALKNESCAAYIPGVKTSYGYIPSFGAGIAFCVLFGLSMIAHTAQFCWKRTWWCAVFSIGAMGKLMLNRNQRIISEYDLILHSS